MRDNVYWTKDSTWGYKLPKSRFKYKKGVLRQLAPSQRGVLVQLGIIKLMGASRNHQTTATEHQNRQIGSTLGRFPELTPVHRVQPGPIPGAGDITPRSEWTSSSTASIRGWANGEVTLDGEAAILAVTNGLESSETSVSIGSSEA